MKAIRRSCLLLALCLFSAPAGAQVNLSGVWNNLNLMHEDWPDRWPGPEIGDYAGVPLNDAARLRADTWDASLITLPEYQCRVHPADYVPSFGGMRIWEERDSASQQLIAIHTHHFAWGSERTIWMDGRGHPPDYALHTSQGFSTGKVERDILTVTTTHLKEGWIRRNGLARSDRATLTEHFIRHDDHLTIVTIVTDPAYLTEPHIRSRDYEYEVGGDIPPYPCEPVEEVIRAKGAIPHHLPGTNPFLGEYAAAHGVPPEAARGGAETMYPEYRKKIRGTETMTRSGLDPVRVAVALIGIVGLATVARALAAEAARPAEAAPAAERVVVPGGPGRGLQQGSREGGQNQDLDNVEIKVQPAQGNVYMLIGAGGNVTVQIGKDGVLVVDAQFAPLSGKIVAAIRTLSNGPIRYIINTHAHGDHTGGNANIRKAGSTIAGGNVSLDIRDASEGAQIIAHDNVLKRMSGAGVQPPIPAAAWPTSTFIGDDKKMFFNGEGIHILHEKSAHTDGDSIVFFRRSDVISAGDIFTTTSYPIIDLAAGGSINGIIDGLNHILDLIIPVYGQEGGTLVIPGHGRLCDMGDVINYREMATIVRDRIQDLVNQGKTLAQVKAARPTRDYDPVYGAAAGSWTTEMFIEAVYKTLTPKKQP